MHLLLIHQAFAGPDEPGGTRHLEFAARMVQQGHQVTVIRAQRNYLTGRPVASSAAQTPERLRIITAGSLGAVHKSFLTRSLGFVAFTITSTLHALRARNVDVIMGTSPPILQALGACLVGLVKRRPVLLEVRDLWPEFAIDMGVLRNPVLIWVARCIERFIYKSARHIVVNSPAYRTYLETKGVEASRVTIIPNGVDASLFDPGSRGLDFREGFGAGSEDTVVLYAGALGMANDIDVILDAASFIKNQRIRFVLAGDGKEASRLVEKARKLRLENVFFAGAFPKSRVPELIAAADICVATLMNIPMFRTTYPNKVFDYMAAGRPTLLAIDGVIRDVIEEAGAGVFVSPGDPRALARATDDLAANPEARGRMGAAARVHVEHHFDRGDQAATFSKLVVDIGS